MGGDSKVITIAAVIIAALVLQVILISAGNHGTPDAAAVEFSEAYFKLNPAMQNYLCDEFGEIGSGEIVNDYLARMADRAKSLGFEADWMKMVLFHIKTETEMLDDNIAEVRIDGSRRRAANPLYGVVAKIFCLGEVHKVHAILTVVRENGHWKVCGEPYDLIEG